MAAGATTRVLRVLATVALVSLAATAATRALCRRLTINITPSLPRGLYWITSRHDPQRGSIVIFFPPVQFRELIAKRGYLPPSVPLLKRVVALPGDAVCTTAGRYYAAGIDLGPVAAADAAGRPLPTPFSFCNIVPLGIAFVAGHGPSSLDSRYFGPLPIATLTVAIAVPLWTSF